MPKKIALITGITGQDGSYLAELLLKKIHSPRYNEDLVHSTLIELTIYTRVHFIILKLFHSLWNLTDASFLNSIVAEIKPNEIYNLVAQSHVKVSFDIPDYTTEVILLEL